MFTEVYCEGTFDSWVCWPHTAANATAYAPCPAFVPGFRPERAYRRPGPRHTLTSLH